MSLRTFDYEERKLITDIFNEFKEWLEEKEQENMTNDISYEIY